MNPREMFRSALEAEGVTGKLADVAQSIYMQESGGGRNTKTSNAGAHGGMQIIPSTFKSVADKDWDINDPMQNARAGIRYLKQLDKMSGGDPALTAAGYYGGPGGMEKARRGVAVNDPRNPNAPNTLQYGQQVVARMNQGKAANLPTAPRNPLAMPDDVIMAQGAPVPNLPVAPAQEAAVMQQMAQAPVDAVAPNMDMPATRAWRELNETLAARNPGIAPQNFMYGMPQMPQVQVPDFNRRMPEPEYAKPTMQAFQGWGSKLNGLLG